MDIFQKKIEIFFHPNTQCLYCHRLTLRPRKRVRDVGSKLELVNIKPLISIGIIDADRTLKANEYLLIFVRKGEPIYMCDTC